MEILIAIFILAVVLSMVYTAYTGTFRNIQETESRADVYQMARVALERMVEDLESAYLSPQTPSEELGETKEEESARLIQFLGEPTEIEGRRADTLRFFSTTHLALEEEDEGQPATEILYTVAEGAEGEGFALTRSDTPTFMGAAGEETIGSMLCDGLYSVSFTYYDEEGEEYDRWDSGEEAFKGRLPMRVSILLVFIDKSDPEAPLMFQTGVALPMGRGAYGETAER